MEILTLVDNVVYGEGLLAEHGLSFLIKHNQKMILFGTGKSGALIHNAGTLGIELSDVDYVVISNIYDHLEGLEAFLNHNHTAVIYMKENTLMRKRFEGYSNQFVFLSRDTWIRPEIQLVTSIHQFGLDAKQYLKRVDERPKPSDELFMLVKLGKKQVIFTGCSPKGILNVIKTAYEKTNQRIYAVCGGMHFTGEILHELDKHLTNLSQFGIKKIYTNHCTGIDGYIRIKNILNASVHYAFTGYHFEIL